MEGHRAKQRASADADGRAVLRDELPTVCPLVVRSGQCHFEVCNGRAAISPHRCIGIVKSTVASRSNVSKPTVVSRTKPCRLPGHPTAAIRDPVQKTNRNHFAIEGNGEAEALPPIAKRPLPACNLGRVNPARLLPPDEEQVGVGLRNPVVRAIDGEAFKQIAPGAAVVRHHRRVAGDEGVNDARTIALVDGEVRVGNRHVGDAVGRSWNGYVVGGAVGAGEGEGQRRAGLPSNPDNGGRVLREATPLSVIARFARALCNVHVRLPDGAVVAADRACLEEPIRPVASEDADQLEVVVGFRTARQVLGAVAQEPEQLTVGRGVVTSAEYEAAGGVAPGAHVNGECLTPRLRVRLAPFARCREECNLVGVGIGWRAVCQRAGQQPRYFRIAGDGARNVAIAPNRPADEGRTLRQPTNQTLGLCPRDPAGAGRSRLGKPAECRDAAIPRHCLRGRRKVGALGNRDLDALVVHDKLVPDALERRVNVGVVLDEDAGRRLVRFGQKLHYRRYLVVPAAGAYVPVRGIASRKAENVGAVPGADDASRDGEVRVCGNRIRHVGERRGRAKLDQIDARSRRPYHGRPRRESVVAEQSNSDVVRVRACKAGDVSRELQPEPCVSIDSGAAAVVRQIDVGAVRRRGVVGALPDAVPSDVDAGGFEPQAKVLLACLSKKNAEPGCAAPAAAASTACVEWHGLRHRRASW